MTNQPYRRVLIVTSRSDFGGGPIHIKTLIECCRNEIDFYIVRPDKGDLVDDLDQFAIHSFSIPFRKFSLIAFIKLVFFCFRNRINVVHSHGRGAGFYARFLKLFGFKIIHTFHGIHDPYFFERYFKFFTDKFICVSESESKLAYNYKLIKKNQEVIIPNGIDSLDVKKNKTNISRSQMTFGTLCREDQVKNISQQINWINRLNSITDDCKFIIAGDEKYKSYSLKSRRIVFEGVYSSPVEFYKKIDVLVSFSKSEGLPLVVLEALSLGIPCLLSRVPGHIDIIDDNVGSLFSLDDFDDFSNKLLTLLKSPELRKNMSSNAKELVEVKFSKKQMRSKVLNLYKSI